VIIVSTKKIKLKTRPIVAVVLYLPERPMIPNIIPASVTGKPTFGSSHAIMPKKPKIKDTIAQIQYIVKYPMVKYPIIVKHVTNFPRQDQPNDEQDEANHKPCSTKRITGENGIAGV
jgi:hypothetical protein